MDAEHVQYKVCLTWDEETGLMVADIPALGIADDGPDTPTALDSVREMALFHMECLLDEREQLPESDEGEGVYIRVQVPVRADQAAPRGVSGLGRAGGRRRCVASSRGAAQR